MQRARQRCRRGPGPMLCLLFVYWVVATWWTASAQDDLTASAYLPFVARPVPTATPIPTATPLPHLLNVRVEGACSNFKGGSARDPSGEWVCFKNYEEQNADMTNWRVQDASAHTYVFPPFSLDPIASVRLHSGAGADTATDLYWGGGAVWNNNHDTVYLYDQFGRLVSRYRY